ncbi:hypothetical protein B0H11DRAFT_1946759 [Mycena galericulata]|nr:hypothetical protein B0H11DRAFT_1946759 [Mycena galericulata]
MHRWAAQPTQPLDPTFMSTKTEIPVNRAPNAGTHNRSLASAAGGAPLPDTKSLWRHLAFILLLLLLITLLLATHPDGVNGVVSLISTGNNYQIAGMLYISGIVSFAIFLFSRKVISTPEVGVRYACLGIHVIL